MGLATVRCNSSIAISIIPSCCTVALESLRYRPFLYKVKLKHVSAPKAKSNDNKPNLDAFILVLWCTEEVSEVNICTYKWHSQSSHTLSHMEPSLCQHPRPCNYTVTKLEDYLSPSMHIDIGTSVCRACCLSLTRASTEQEKQDYWSDKWWTVQASEYSVGEKGMMVGGRKRRKRWLSDFNSESWHVIIMWWMVSL